LDATVQKINSFHAKTSNELDADAPMKTQHLKQCQSNAFSLIELLVVIAIIGIIGTFAVPAAGNLLKGSSLTQAANLLTDQIAAARQHAVTRNRVVEVRFYRFADPEIPGENASDPSTGQYRGLQYVEFGENGVPNPVGKVVRFPDSVMMNPSPTLSSLLGVDTSRRKVTMEALDPNDPELPRGVGKKYRYVSFRFLPDGSTSLPITGESNGLWFVTVHLINDLGRATEEKPPPNFFTWMIEPVSGNSKVLRPGVKK
jgi:uncharacterized protein (TIGR02596 family)